MPGPDAPTEPPRPPRDAHRRALASTAARLALALASVAVTLTAVEGTMRLLELAAPAPEGETPLLVDAPSRTEGQFTYDAHLGWRNRPSFSESRGWRHGTTTRETINASGWRGPDVSPARSPGTFRVACLGGSFTYGYGVNAEDAYPAALERLLAAEATTRSAERRFEVLNFGVNGYGLTQILLNYAEHVRAYRPDLVLLQLNDFHVYRSLYTDMWQTPKPAFVLSDGELRLTNHPVPPKRTTALEQWLRHHSRLYRWVVNRLLVIEETRKLEAKGAVSESPEALELAVALLQRLDDEVRADGGTLVAFLAGPEASWRERVCERAGIECFRLRAFERMRPWLQSGKIFNPAPAGHWSPHGHQYVARALANYLVQERGVLPREPGVPPPSQGP